MAGYINGKKYLSASEAAKRFGYTSDYVSKLAREGKVNAQKIDRAWFVDGESLLAFIAEGKRREFERRDELKRDRVREYHEIKPHQRTGTGTSSISYGVQFARIAASVLGVSIFILSFAFTSSVMATHPREQVSRFLTEIVPNISVSRAKEDVVSLVRSGFSFNLNDVKKGGAALVRQSIQTAEAVSVWHDRFTTELAMIWVERHAVRKEIESDIVSTPVGAWKDLSKFVVSLPESVQKGAFAFADFEILIQNKVQATEGIFAKLFESAADASLANTLFAYQAIDNQIKTTTRSFLSNFAWWDVITNLFSSSMVQPEVATQNTPPTAQGSSEPQITTIVEKPTTVVQNVTNAVTYAGVSESFLNAKLQQLENAIRSDLFTITAAPTPSRPSATGGLQNQIILSQKIDQLSGVAISGGTITGATLSDVAASGSFSGTFSGELTSSSSTISTLTVSNLTTGTTTVTGPFSVSGGSGLTIIDGNLGIGTTSPYAPLSVVGEAVASYFTATSTTATSTFFGKVLAAFTPSVPHTFGAWAPDVADSGAYDAAFYVNPLSSIGDGNLIAAAVNGSVKFLVDAEGDVYTRSLVATGGVTLSTTTATAFTVQDNTTLGDSLTDVTTINGQLIVNGSTTIAMVAGNFGVGTSSPWARISASNLAGDSRPLLALSTSTASATSTAFLVNANGKVGIGTTSPSQQLSVEGNAFISGSLNIGSLSLGSLSGILKATSGVISSATAGVDYLTDAFRSWTLSANVFGQSALAPTSTQNIAVSGIGTSTFAGGLEAWRQIGAPYFNATSTTATSTFAGGVAAGALDVSGKTTLGTASTTNISASYASSTQGFFGSLSLGNLTGFLKATAGSIATSLIDLATDVGSSILAVINGGTGWGEIQANTILLGNGTNKLATTSAGTNGQVLALINGVPTWAATTTFSSGLSYSGGAVTNTGLLSLAQTYGSAQTGALTVATSSDTNVLLSITNSGGAFTFTPSWTGTLAASRLNSSVVQGITNDTNITGSISNQNLTLGWVGALSATRGGTGQDTSGYSGILGINNGTYYQAATTTFSSGLSYAAGAVTNTGVLSNIAGAGINVSGATGNIIISQNDAYRIATTSGLAVSGLAYFTQTSGVTTLGSAATTSVSCAGSLSCSSFDILGASPVTLTGSGLTAYDAWSHLTTYGATASATTSPLWAQGALYASSTVAFGTAGKGFFFNATNGFLGLASTSPWAQVSINPNGIAGPAFAIGSSTATSFIVDNAGKVGIATTTPGSLFAINGVANFKTGTSTLYTGLRVEGNLNVTGAATSTFTNGIQLTSGCFMLPSGECAGTGSGSGGSGGGQLLAVYATSTPGSNVSVNFNGAANSAPSFSAGVLTLPSNASYYMVDLWGGGGGGGGGARHSTSGGSCGSGGGSGGYVRKLYTTTSTNYYTIGSGGSGGAGISGTNSAGNDGSAGNQSCFGTSATACSAPTLTANGGANGFGGGTTGGRSGGAGGSSSGGDVSITGGAGGGGMTTNTGSAGGPGGEGGNATSGGTGGEGGLYTGGNGGSGTGFGGGGGGGGGDSSSSGSGGRGGAGGLVISIYTTGVSNGSIGSGTAGYLPYFDTAGTNLTATSTLFLATNQNVGIGSTTPWAKLSVNAPGGMPAFVVGSSTTQFIVGPNGNVGIATTTPGSLFAINGVANFKTGTSTLYTGLRVEGNLNVTGTATSTFTNGIDLTGGCFAVNGTCVTGSSGGSGTGGARLSAVHVYTANDTWTKPSNIDYVITQVIGAGGGGGGAATNGSGQVSGGGGGGGGAACIVVAYSANLSATESISVGSAGGGGSAGNTGTTGGNSSFGAFATAGGGTGGTGGSAISTQSTTAGGAGGSCSGSPTVSVDGERGDQAFLIANANATNKSGGGGTSGLRFGAGGPERNGNLTAGASAGADAAGYGGGGSGAYNRQSNTGTAGGSGTAGAVIVYEYSQTTDAQKFTEANGSVYLATTTNNFAVGTSTPYSKLTVWGGTSGRNIFEAVTSASSTAFVVSNSGLVGVGTTSPWAKLSVNAPGGMPAFVVGSSTTQFIVGPNGNVGIATTSPSSLFSINNVANFKTGTSTLYTGLRVEGNLNVTGAATSTFTNGIQLTSGCFRLPSGECAGTGTGSSGTATSGPSFSVHRNNVDQSVTVNTPTKIDWTVEEFDTNDNFDLTNDRFQPTVAGKYLISLQVFCSAATISCTTWIYKNGSQYRGGYTDDNGSNVISATAVIDFNGTTDYVEGWGRTNAGTIIDGNVLQTYMTGALIAPVGVSGGGWTNDGTQSYLLDSADLVGVGTTSPWAKLSVNAPAGIPAFTVGSSTTLFHIDESGNVGVGITSLSQKFTAADSVSGNGVARIYNSANSTTAHGLYIQAGSNSSAGSLMIYFRRPDGTTLGSVSQNGATSVAYNTTSDERTKENIATTTTGLDTLLNIAVRDFEFIGDPAHVRTQGFIAQELYGLYPYAVTTNGDDGEVPLTASSTPWQVDYGRLTPLIVKSIQDLNLKLDALATTTPSEANQSFVGAFFENLFTRIVAWFASAANGIGDFFANKVHTKEICVSDEEGETCLTRSQLAALLAGTVTSTSTPPSDTASSTPSAAAIEIIINGNDPAYVDLGATYADLGATASSTDASLTALGVRIFYEGEEVTSVTLDTTTDSTHTITYKVIDADGDTLATATRTVIVGTGEPTVPEDEGPSATTTPETAEPTIIDLIPSDPDIIFSDTVATSTDEGTASTTPESGQ